MLTRFITEVSTVFNPFSPKAKTARLFLSFLPPDARQDIKVTTRLLPRASRDPSVLQVKFSKSRYAVNRTTLTVTAQRMAKI
jgi:large subunit ribosomal protein L53